MKWKQLNDVLKDWKNNDLVYTIEMGGLGPGYEQALQTLVFEACTKLNGIKYELVGEHYPENFTRDWDKIVHKLDKKYGFSGAMVGAAKWLTFRYLWRGYGKTLDDFDSKKAHKDRVIQVKRKFP